MSDPPAKLNTKKGKLKMNTLEIITRALVVALGGFMIIGVAALVIDTVAEVSRDYKNKKAWKLAAQNHGVK